MKARVPLALLLTAAATVLLWQNGRANVASEDLVERLPGWRGWDDLAIAAGHQVSGDFPVASYRITNRFRRDQPDFLAFRGRVLGGVRRLGIRPHQFWRVLEGAPFDADELVVATRWDDPGRALLLSLGFEALGGVAPFLLSWLALLAAIPVVAWAGAESLSAGQGVMGATLVALLGSSAFLVDTLMHGYSAVGFSLLALLLLLVLAIHACCCSPTPLGLLLRGLLAGVLFGFCAAARSTSLLSLGGAASALAIGAWRARPAVSAVGANPLTRSSRLLLGATAVALYLLPWAGVQQLNRHRLRATEDRLRLERLPEQQHDIWVTLWQGLGDFDRTKGHVFLDEAGAREAHRHGSPERLSPTSERLFRQLLWRDVREDPGWFAGILVRRAWATLSLQKLSPWGPRDGRSFSAASNPAEGATDAYYAMVRGADFFRVGRGVREAPVSVLLLPSLGLALFALGPRRGSRDFARRGLAAMACVALGTLPSPVLLTTASAFETQSFVVVYLLGGACFAQLLADSLRRAAAARAGSRR